MRKKIVAGNWKMNLTVSAAHSLVNDLISSTVLEKLSDEKRFIICPPYLYIESLANKIDDTSKLKLGAQNCSQFSSGAYTGEVAADMLQSIGCEYVIVGHSERRMYFNENNEQLLQKVKRCLEQNLKVIFCCGEKLEDRELNNHESVVFEQLNHTIFQLKENEMKDVIIAYEPVWAIGTGKTASTQQAQEMHHFIRNSIAQVFDNQLAQNISILYGGSCKPSNAKELFAQEDIDGGLIGGASLNANEFIDIIKCL
jgi:triosephosphate isomerase (TIM)